MYENFPKHFRDNEGPYQKENLMREYEIAYTTFKEKIDALNEDVRNVIYSIRPTQEDIDAYVAQPIEHLQETIDTFELTPDTVHNAAVLMRVLLAKLENIQE